MKRIARRSALLSLLALNVGCGGGGGGASAAPAPAPAPALAPAPAPAPAPASPYPDYNTQALVADPTGMAETATQIAAKIRIGLNIGNTLEATPGRSETVWGNPKITKSFVQFVRTQASTPCVCPRPGTSTPTPPPPRSKLPGWRA